MSRKASLFDKWLLGQVIYCHNLLYHFYSSDRKPCLAFKPLDCSRQPCLTLILPLQQQITEVQKPPDIQFQSASHEGTVNIGRQPQF